jgi:hypothetical protein
VNVTADDLQKIITTAIATMFVGTTVWLIQVEVRLSNLQMAAGRAEETRHIVDQNGNRITALESARQRQWDSQTTPRERLER